MRGRPRFFSGMTKTQKILGWIFAPFYLFLLPLLLSVYAIVQRGAVSMDALNLVYSGTGIVFVLVVMLSWLRRNWDVLLDNLWRCVLFTAVSVGLTIGLGLLAGALMLWLAPAAEENPNQAEVAALAQENYGMVLALAVFIAPIVEETLFRGVMFGTLRGKSRVLAYVVSILLFCFCHVWQYLFASGDSSMLVYMLEYVAAGFALDFCYDTTGSIWPCIFLHMGLNAVATNLLTA